MAYSIEAELRANLPELSNPAHVATITPAWCAAVIAKADLRVDSDVLALVGTIAAHPATPGPIRLLAQYAAMEEALIRLYGRSRVSRDKPDIDGARTDYEKQLVKIENREVSGLTYVAQLEATWRDDQKKPQFGEGKYGEYIQTDTPPDIDDAAEDREAT